VEIGQRAVWSPCYSQDGKTIASHFSHNERSDIYTCDGDTRGVAAAVETKTPKTKTQEFQRSVHLMAQTQPFPVSLLEKAIGDQLYGFFYTSVSFPEDFQLEQNKTIVYRLFKM